MNRLLIATTLVALLSVGELHAQGRVRAATEAAEWLIGRYGAKAGRTVPELASRIEVLAARHGEEATIMAVRKGGPAACGLIEAAGADGAKAVRVLTIHGELGAARVLSRPVAMKQYLLLGDECATVLVRHPGIAEPLVERAGASAVKALGAITPQNGRRLAMLMDGELAQQAGRHPEVLGVIANHGDRAVNFLWQNKGAIAGGAALTAFLANPEPYLNGTQQLMTAAGDSVVKPVVGGFFNLVNTALIVVGVLIVGIIVIVHKHGVPKPEHVKSAIDLIKKK